MRAPPEPGYSCPHLDEAIGEIERARKIHDELRKWGQYWESRAEEIEKDMQAQIDELQSDIDRLEAELSEARAATLSQ